MVTFAILSYIIGPGAIPVLLFLGGEIMKFFESNELKYRLLRTIIQGVIGVLVANIDLIIGFIPIIPEALRGVIVLVIMAVLSPIMAELGKRDKDE